MSDLKAFENPNKPLTNQHDFWTAGIEEMKKTLSSTDTPQNSSSGLKKNQISHELSQWEDTWIASKDPTQRG